MFRILEQQAPPKQSATETINTLSSRLQSATLLEDRRAAILGLRSFAKLYPASVASGALRNLINSLSSDTEDVDTIKIVLETLLMLFSPDESSPEASEEIALWLADEFTQRQENITVLFDLLEKFDFFCRLYSLQLISAISGARPERTQECVYTAPLGISRLVAILEDKREAVQNEALLLLIALTPASPELQKLVVFENAFDRIFAIINSEGALIRGTVVVQDCLSLLANLLRLNVSNQSYFREAGGMPKAANILNLVTKEDSSGEEEGWTSPQKDKNIWGFLSVIRLFLQGGGAAAQMNQNAFWQHGLTSAILEICFSMSMTSSIRSEALFTCADLIRCNGGLQEKFAYKQVSMHVPIEPATAAKSQINGQAKQPPHVTVNVITALIDTSFAVSSQEPLDIRLAACECLKAYLQGHAEIRRIFLERAKEGHLAADIEIDNIFTILMDDGSSVNPADVYRQWIASVLLFNLLYDDYDAKKTAMNIAEGDSAKGEEVVTCIQILCGNLITSAQRGADDRIPVAYLTLLCGWLFEDPDAVNDFLQEGSNVQSLIQLVLQPNQQKALEAGLCAFLLGIIYEFSSKDSPISRSTLHELLTSRLGRDQFNDRLTKLREHPLIRDFEVLPQGIIPDQYGGQPELSFDKLFVEFLKDNFSRISRSLDRDPGMEVSVITNGVQRGISRELVDSLKSQVDDKVSALQIAESTIINLEQRLGQEQADLRKAKESAAAELTRIKNINDSLQRNHEQELKQAHQRYEQDVKQLQQNHNQATSHLQRNHQSDVDKLRGELNKARSEAESKLLMKISSLEKENESSKKAHSLAIEDMRSQHQKESQTLSAKIKTLDDEATRAADAHANELRNARNEQRISRDEQERSLRSAEARLKEAEHRAKTAEEEVGKSESRAKKVEKELEETKKTVAEKEEARVSVQTELDDLFMVLADLEEKRTMDKERLKAVGEDVSGDEDDEDDEDEEEEAEEADGEEEGKEGERETEVD